MSNNRNGRKNPFGKIFIEINKVLLSNSYLTKKYLVTVSGGDIERITDSK